MPFSGHAVKFNIFCTKNRFKIWKLYMIQLTNNCGIVLGIQQWLIESKDFWLVDYYTVTVSAGSALIDDNSFCACLHRKLLLSYRFECTRINFNNREVYTKHQPCLIRCALVENFPLANNVSKSCTIALYPSYFSFFLLLYPNWRSIRIAF